MMPVMQVPKLAVDRRRKQPWAKLRQGGMVTLLVILLLIGTVVFVLTQTLDISSGNVADGQRSGESQAAFFLAESGLDKAQAGVTSGLLGSYSNTSCTGISSTYALGRGNVELSTVSTPAACVNGSTTPCSGCAATSTGMVGSSKRVLQQDIAVTVRNGTTCNASTNNCTNTPLSWLLNLRNTASVAGIGVFNLTYGGQGNNQATCATASNCRLQIDVDSPAAGNDSTAMMVNAVLIPSGGSYPIYQTTTQNRNAAEVGVFFLGTTAPTLTGPTANPGAASYWNTQNTGPARTVGSGSATTGGTNDGTFSSGGTCDAPSANVQSCTSWCYGGDTLVFSYAGAVTALTDELSSVTFSTNLGTGQNIAMTRVTKYPNNLVAGAPTDVDAEIWYARNPNFVPSTTPLALNASSYKGVGNSAFGASWLGSATDTSKVSGAGGAGSGNTLTVGSTFTTYPAQMITPGPIGTGDVLSSSGGSAAANVNCTPTCPTVLAQVTSAEPGGALGGRGTYTISGSPQAVSSANNRVWTVSSNVLNVSSCTTCYFQSSDALSGLLSGRTITAQATPLGTVATRGRVEATGGVGRYTTSGVTPVQLAGNIRAGTPGTTIYLPPASSQPVTAIPPMRIAVKSGTGAFAPGTTVTAINAPPNAVTNAFTVSTAPATPLENASICGGTCAFFNPGAAAETTFTIGSPAIRWAAGFMCLKGVDIVPQIVTSSSTALGRWTEVIN